MADESVKRTRTLRTPIKGGVRVRSPGSPTTNTPRRTFANFVRRVRFVRRRLGIQACLSERAIAEQIGIA